VLRRLFSRIVAKYYLKRPDVAELIEARYQTWSSLLYASLNLVAFNLKRDRGVRLTSAVLEPTNHCNLKCIMCTVNTSMKRKQGYMDLALFKRVIDDNPQLEYILLFNYGEPLMHPKIFEMIEYAAERGIRPNVTTNGTLLKDDLIDKIVASKLDRITISIDGVGEVYEKIRGTSYAKLEAKVNRLIEIRNATDSNLKIDLAVSVFEMNEDRIQELYDVWENKVDRFQLQPRMYLEAGTAPAELKRTQRCDEVWRGNLIVLWDGTVVPCCYDSEGAMPVGDANTDRLRDIINGEKMRQLRRNLVERRFLGVCANCLEYQTPVVTPRFRSD